MKYIMAVLMMMINFNVAAHDGNDGWVTIQGYSLWSSTYKDPQIRVMIKNDTYYNPARVACGELDSYMVSTQLSQAQQDKIFSILLSASIAQKSVRIRLDRDSCELNRPAIITAVI